MRLVYLLAQSVQYIYNGCPFLRRVLVLHDPAEADQQTKRVKHFDNQYERRDKADQTSDSLTDVARVLKVVVGFDADHF